MDFSTWLKQYPVPLNPQQKEAVQTVNGPVLLLAVPGSGKTTVLVMRLGWMVQGCNIPPSSIVTITYTVSAVNDMKNRYASFFGKQAAEQMVFRTINGICARIIYQYGRIIQKPPYELISDDRIINQMIISIYQEIMHEYPSENDVKEIRTKITYIKNMMLSDQEINALNQGVTYDLSAIYHRYCTKLRNERCMDYDDQMVYALRILKTDPAMAKRVQQQFTYICVDEAQDTSRIQHEIIRLIASMNANLFMVGDEDQSIYGFRAAWPQALLDFHVTYPNGRVLLMEENFRSVPAVVNLADRFVSANTDRHEKHMHAFRTQGNDVTFVQLKTRSRQIRHIISTVQESDEQTAVLFRNNENAIPLIDQLERKQIPYAMRNVDAVFFSHRIVNDVCTILRFLMDPSDVDAFVKVYYKLNLYLKKEEAMKIASSAKKSGKTIFTTATSMKLQDYSVNGLKTLKETASMIHQKDAMTMLQIIFDTLGYRSYLQHAHLSDDKLYILQQIARYVKDVSSFLQRLDELADLIRTGKQDSDARLVLSTIHSSKGLEYDRVILLDCVDGVLPSVPQSQINPEHRDAVSLYQEERRLFYVAITRAKNRLILYDLAQSSFVAEVRPQKRVEEKKKSADDFPSFMKKLKKGRKIVHEEYGEGVITKKDAKTVIIRFGTKTKIFMIRFIYDQQLVHPV